MTTQELKEKLESEKYVNSWHAESVEEEFNLTYEYYVHLASNSLYIYGGFKCEDGVLTVTNEHFEVFGLYGKKIFMDGREDNLNSYIYEIRMYDSDGEFKIYSFDQLFELDEYIKSHNESIYERYKEDLQEEYDENLENLREEQLKGGYVDLSEIEELKKEYDYNIWELDYDYSEVPH